MKSTNWIGSRTKEVSLGKRRKGDKPSPAQMRAMLDNNCLRELAALDRAYQLAGYDDLREWVDQLRVLTKTRIGRQ